MVVAFGSVDYFVFDLEIGYHKVSVHLIHNWNSMSLSIPDPVGPFERSVHGVWGQEIPKLIITMGKISFLSTP